MTFILEFLVGTHRDILKSSTCVASVFVDCIASLPACHRFWPQALAEALKVNTTLTNINLEACGIGVEEAKPGARQRGPGRGTWMVVETRESREVLGLWIL